jgi:hypothetical protein
VPSLAAGGLAYSFGQHPPLAKPRCVEGQKPVRLTEILSAQYDSFSAVQSFPDSQIRYPPRTVLNRWGRDQFFSIFF